VDTVSQKGDPKVNSPIGIAIDETGVPRRAEEERKAASEHIASEIMRDLDTGYTAMSSKTKAANQKREDELNKRYAGRQKNADVPLTEESIWGDIMEDFGEAPQVKLPGESKGKSETKTDKGESAPVEKSVESVEKSESKPESKGPKSKLFQNKNKPKEEPKKEAPKEEKQAAAKKADEDIHPAKYDAIKMSPRIRDLSVPDKHKLRIALDTVKNPNKALLGGPSVEEAQETIYKLTGRRVATVKVAEELGGDFTECPDCKSKGTSFTAPRGAGNSQYKCKTCNDTGRIFKPTKKADCVRPDIAEARSKVVSPNTVDKDIKQPTKSVEEAAKVASFLVKYADMEWYSRVVDAFGDPRKAHQWMTTPSKEFGGKTPIKALEENNMDSSILEPFLTRMEHGVDYDPGKVGGAIDWVKDKLVQNKPKLSPEEQKVFNALYSREMNQARSEYMGEVNQQIDEDGRQGRVWTEMYKRFPHLSKGASGISEKKTVKVNCPECGNKSGFRTKAGELKCFGCSHSWSDKTACEEIDSMCGDKVSSDVSGDISEAKSKVVSPDTVDRDIKQPTKSVEEAAKVAAWVTYDDLTSAGTATLGRITRTMPDLIKKYGEDAVLEGVYEATSQLGHLEEIGSSDVSFWVRQVIKDLERNPNQRNLDEEHTASAGDENDESVEMELGFGDLADLGANMPRQAITAEMHAPIPSGTLAKRVKELNAEGLYSAAAIAKKLNVSVDRVKAVIEGSK
jgi:transposase-like protein